MPIHVSSQKAQEILSKLEKIPCPYSGEKLSINETKKMTEHLIPAKKSYDANILKNDPAKAEVLEKYLKKLDEIIIKNPKDIILLNYRTLIEKIKK